MSSELPTTAAIQWRDGHLAFVQSSSGLLSRLVQKHQPEVAAQEVLRQVNVRVPEGATVVIIGPSGQGKTSLLKVLAGLIPPTGGELFIRGHDWKKRSPEERRRELQKIGMLFQRNALFDSLTCLENVAFPLREAHPEMEDAEALAKAQFYLDAVGLSTAGARLPYQLSGGMQKRLGIARAMALEPSLIFYDDPTAGLDPLTSRKIIQLILDQQQEKNSTVLAVTNDMARAQQLARRPQDQIWFVQGKRVVVEGPAQQILHSQHQDLRAFWDGRLLPRLAAAT